MSWSEVKGSCQVHHKEGRSNQASAALSGLLAKPGTYAFSQSAQYIEPIQ